MPVKLPEHPNGGKHKWAHVKNVTMSDHRYHRDGTSSVTVKYRGIYACECGAQKTGRSA